MAPVRGIRGATTAGHNTREAIVEATRNLLEKLIQENELDVDDIAAAFFTTTEDLNAEFPTQAARQMGWEYVALMNGHEMSVPNTLAQCIRVMLLVNTNKTPQELVNIYIRGAANLRHRGMEDA